MLASLQIAERKKGGKEMRKRVISVNVTMLLMLATTLLLSMSTLISSAAASPVIADNPTIGYEGTGEDFNWLAWGGWWFRGGTTAIVFTFTGISTATIPTDSVSVNFNLAVTNHVDGDFGLDGLVDITINPDEVVWTYTIANVLFDNVDPANHLAAWGEQTYESYATTASIIVNKDYIRSGTLVVKVHRTTDIKDKLPSVTTCTYAPIDMSTSPPTVPTGCYDYNNAHTVHIEVKTTDSTGTRAANGEVTITEGPVGGFWVPVDKLGLFAPYIGVISTIVVATAVTAIYVKRVKHRKKQ